MLMLHQTCCLILIFFLLSIIVIPLKYRNLLHSASHTLCSRGGHCYFVILMTLSLHHVSSSSFYYTNDAKSLTLSSKKDLYLIDFGGDVYQPLP